MLHMQWYTTDMQYANKGKQIDELAHFGYVNAKVFRVYKWVILLPSLN